MTMDGGVFMSSLSATVGSCSPVQLFLPTCTHRPRRWRKYKGVRASHVRSYFRCTNSRQSLEFHFGECRSADPITERVSLKIFTSTANLVDALPRRSLSLTESNGRNVFVITAALLSAVHTASDPNRSPVGAFSSGLSRPE